jgi:hypothetical protein
MGLLAETESCHQLCVSGCRLLLHKLTSNFSTHVFMSSIQKHDPTAVEEAQKESAYHIVKQHVCACTRAGQGTPVVLFDDKGRSISEKREAAQKRLRATLARRGIPFGPD